MNKKILMVGLVLALTLVLVAPVPALAAKPVTFEANGIITEVSPGNIFAAGNSGRWVVDERQMFGTITGNVGGDFELTYTANVDLETQAGSFHGTLEVGSLLFRVRGKSQLVEDSDPDPGPWVEIAPDVFVPTIIRTLETIGGWTLIQGAKGNGGYYGWATVLIASAGPLEGHILGVVSGDDVPGASGFTMTGQWHP